MYEGIITERTRSDQINSTLTHTQTHSHAYPHKKPATLPNSKPTWFLFIIILCTYIWWTAILSFESGQEKIFSSN